MPIIGKPTFKDNKFSEIAMHSPQTADKIEDKFKGQSLKFVDRNSHNKMGKDDFLKLLTHQLTNQDPLQPMDQKKFAADLAQFSSLEQLSNINTKIEQMVGEKMGGDKLMGAALLGKGVITQGTSVNYNGTATEIPFSLPKDASKTLVTIYDQRGQQIQQLDLPALKSGPNSVVWDGVAYDGVQSPSGNYTVRVLAWDDKLSPFEGTTTVNGKVSKVSFEGGETVLSLEDGKRIFLRDVESFVDLGENKIKTQQLAAKKMLDAYQQAQGE